jgi:release factor glutamine methyltransferase
MTRQAAGNLTSARTIAGLRRTIAQSFRTAGLETAELDARILIGHALGLNHTQLAGASQRMPSADECELVTVFAARRLQGEPVARILGEKEFWGLTLHLSPETLVPRPESEAVVEAALKAIGRVTKSMRLADLGTGSGALLLALLSEVPQAFGIGTDLSIGALATARDNAARLGLSARAGFVACDYARALAGPFDCIVCNPPYIATRDIATLAPEVRDHDPHLALDGGEDGLDGYRAIAADAARLLAPGGSLMVELGAGLVEGVSIIMSVKGLIPDGPAQLDVAGISRALAFRHLP